MLEDKRTYALSVAGFDPSGGAGILADCKTFEQQGVIGLGVLTANTLQTEDSFEGCHWVPRRAIELQLRLLLARYPVTGVKFGIVPSTKQLKSYRRIIESLQPNCPVVVDTVLSATAGGYQFSKAKGQQLLECVRAGDLITPNAEEFQQLFGAQDARTLSQATGVHILVKGGHRDDEGARVIDRLYSPEGKYEFAVPRSERSKHGTGCVLSASITACLAQGMGMAEACAVGQLYVSRYINSAEGRLGVHRVME